MPYIIRKEGGDYYVQSADIKMSCIGLNAGMYQTVHSPFIYSEYEKGTIKIYLVQLEKDIKS